MRNLKARESETEIKEGKLKKIVRGSRAQRLSTISRWSYKVVSKSYGFLLGRFGAVRWRGHIGVVARTAASDHGKVADHFFRVLRFAGSRFTGDQH